MLSVINFASASSRQKIIVHAFLIVLCFELGAGVSYSLGQDINFDQLNYHFYTAYAFWNDGLARDVAPSQLSHSFLNPIVYFPFYFMVRNLPPWSVGVVLGAIHGLNLWLAGLVTWVATGVLRPNVRFATTVLSVIVAAASPMAISEAGTSMSDVLISLLVLTSLTLLIGSEFRDGHTTRTIFHLGVAGAILGAATSLKLTAAVFYIAFTCAVGVGRTTWRNRLAAVVAAGLGGVVGFFAVGGFWYVRMWRMFGNPFFPYYNAVFRSPDFESATSIFDQRFLPNSFLEALSYPFRWATSQQLTSELQFRDIRFAVIIILGFIALSARLFFVGRPSKAMRTASGGGARLLTFCVIAFGLWMHVWSIQRYLVPLELLTGTAIVVLLLWCGLSRIVDGWAITATTGMIAIACVMTVKVPDWGHMAWTKNWYVVDTPAVGDRQSVYFLDLGPYAYVVPELGTRASAIGSLDGENQSTDDTIFLRHIRSLVDDMNNGVFFGISAGPLSEGFKQTIGRYGLAPDGECTTKPGRPMSLTWCTLVRTKPSQ